MPSKGWGETLAFRLHHLAGLTIKVVIFVQFEAVGQCEVLAGGLAMANNLLVKTQTPYWV
jgi:hypothetical protein